MDAQNNVVYGFDGTSGLLVNISSTLDSSIIVFRYNGQEQVESLSHSNGKTMRISYTESGRISSVDVLDESEVVVSSR